MAARQKRNQIDADLSPLNSNAKKKFIDEVALLAGPEGIEQICNDPDLPIDEIIRNFGVVAYHAFIDRCADAQVAARSRVLASVK